MPTTERPAGRARSSARELLATDAAAKAQDPRANAAGYLDLLGGELESTGTAQDLMIDPLRARRSTSATGAPRSPGPSRA